MAVFFHTIDTEPQLKHKLALKRWIRDQILAENREVGTINVIFCSDAYLLEVNRTHLNHDYYTDIITFDYCQDKVVSGDLYISSERVLENSSTFKKSIQEETHRVIIHGVMHLCGYKDKTKSEALTMRKKEENSLLKIQEYISV
ncbi:MAG: rRNA maturation RNase YbeY [Flavobacteriales bacterium]|jgi:probable rRNA maturation factor